MKIRFEGGGAYYSGYGSASLVVEASGKAESEIEVSRFAVGLEQRVSSLVGMHKVNRSGAWLHLETQARAETDLALRAALIDAIVATVTASGARFSPLPVVDWLTYPYRERHTSRVRDELLRYGPDRARFERLQAMRLPSITPWLSGQQPVRDLGVFAAFHALGPEDQAVVRLCNRDGQVNAPASCPDGCHPSWLTPVLGPLVSAGWLRGQGRQFFRGPLVARLNQAAGEMMAD